MIVDESKTSLSIQQACKHIIAAEEEIDRLDSVVGDGDCGSTLARTARAILQVIGKDGFASANGDIVQILEILAIVVEENMDGTSGALYAIFLNALASSLRATGFKLPEPRMIQRQDWAQASIQALSVLQRATPARVGDRTIMDALDPFVRAIQNGVSAAAAIDEARAGRDSTQGMTASLGRAVYVPEEGWSQVPDPGAAGLVCLLEGLLQS